MKKRIIIVFVYLIVLASVLRIISINDKDKARLYFFPLKEADCTLITYKEKFIMIDTGEAKDEQIIENTINKFKLKRIDYLILTHPDKDHIGNAEYLIKKYEIGEIFQPNYNKQSKLQKELDEKIKEKNIKNSILTEKYEFNIENLKISIYPPEKQYEDSNNNSLITLLSLNTKKALFTGDIREERIKDILNNLQEVDLLKFPYHGRKNDLSKEFIDKLKPKLTVITGENPDEDIIKKLEEVKSKIRLTSKQKVDITFE